MAIREKTTVRVISGLYAGNTGKVVNTYPALDVAIVSIDDNGEIVKISLSALVEIQPQERRETKPEIPEGAKKITRADFDAAMIRVTTRAMSESDSSTSFKGAMTSVIVGEAIGSEIFKESDVVVMTEDQFIVAMWDCCNPQRVNEIVKNKMSLRHTINVAIAAVINLRKIPEILFDGDSE